MRSATKVAGAFLCSLGEETAKELRTAGNQRLQAGFYGPQGGGRRNKNRRFLRLCRV